MRSQVSLFLQVLEAAGLRMPGGLLWILSLSQAQSEPPPWLHRLRRELASGPAQELMSTSVYSSHVPAHTGKSCPGPPSGGSQVFFLQMPGAQPGSLAPGSEWRPGPWKLVYSRCDSGEKYSSFSLGFTLPTPFLPLQPLRQNLKVSRAWLLGKCTKSGSCSSWAHS